jgi:hypothetical protein
VAAVLLLALVAIPLLLLKSAPEQSQPAPGAPASAPAQMAGSPASVAISDVSGTAYAGVVRGNVKNPFKPQGIPAVASSGGGAGTSVPSTASSGGGSASGSGSTGAGTPQGGTGTRGGGKTGTPKPPPADGDVSPDVVATIEFGLAGAKPKKSEVPEFTPLPSSTSPVVVYMGQSNDDEATFLVSSDVTPSGDGRCFPDDKTCSTLYLKPGDVAYLTAGTNDGQPVKYRLKFIKAEDED